MIGCELRKLNLMKHEALHGFDAPFRSHYSKSLHKHSHHSYII